MMDDKADLLKKLDSRYLSWSKLGKAYFESSKLSNMMWKKDIPTFEFKLENCTITSVPNGGPIALVINPIAKFDPSDKNPLRNKIMVFNGYGKLLYSRSWSDNKFRQEYPLFQFSEWGDLVIITPDSMIYVLNAWGINGRILKENFIPEKAVLLGKQVYILGYHKAKGSTEKEFLMLKSYKKAEVESYSKSEYFKVLRPPYYMVALSPNEYAKPDAITDAEKPVILITHPMQGIIRVLGQNVTHVVNIAGQELNEKVTDLILSAKQEYIGFRMGLLIGSFHTAEIKGNFIQLQTFDRFQDSSELKTVVFCSNQTIMLIYANAIGIPFQKIKDKQIDVENSELKLIEYNSSSKDNISTIYCQVENDGMRIITLEATYFFRVTPKPMLTAYTDISDPSHEIISAYILFLKGDANAEQKIKLQKDSKGLKDAIKTMQECAAVEFDINVQKQLLKAISMSKSFLEKGEFLSEEFSKLLRVLRCINNLRNEEYGYMITYEELQTVSKKRFIKSLLNCKYGVLATEIIKQLKISSEFLNVVYKYWAVQKMNDTNDVSEENTYNTLMEELQKVKNFNYLKLALKAIDNHKDKLGIMLLSNEPCIGAKIPLLVNKMLYSEALSMAINYGDSDIIYGVLLDHFKKEVLEKEKNEMNDRTAFIEKILKNERAKPYLISFSRILIEICNDEKFSDCLYKYLNRINKADSQTYEEIMYLLTSIYNTKDPTKHKIKLDEADQAIRDKFVKSLLESWKELEYIKTIKDTKLLKHFTTDEMFTFQSSMQVIETLIKKGSKEVDDICKTLKVTGKTAYVLKLKGLIDEGSNYEAVYNLVRQIKDDIGWDILSKYAIDKKATKIAQILIDRIKDPEQKCLYLVQLNLWKDAILIMKKIKDEQLKTRVANLIIKWTHDLFNLTITKEVDEALNAPS